MNPSKSDKHNYEAAPAQFNGFDQFHGKPQDSSKRYMEQQKLAKFNDSYIRADQITSPPAYPPVDFNAIQPQNQQAPTAQPQAPQSFQSQQAQSPQPHTAQPQAPQQPQPAQNPNAGAAGVGQNTAQPQKQGNPANNQYQPRPVNQQHSAPLPNSGQTARPVHAPQQPAQAPQFAQQHQPQQTQQQFGAQHPAAPAQKSKGLSGKVQALIALGIVAVVAIVAFALVGNDDDSSSTDSAASSTPATEQAPATSSPAAQDPNASQPAQPAPPAAGKPGFDQLPEDLKAKVVPDLCNSSLFLSGLTGDASLKDAVMCITNQGVDGPFLSLTYAPDPALAGEMAKAADSGQGFTPGYTDLGLVSKDGHKVMSHDNFGSVEVKEIRNDGVINYAVNDLEKFKKMMVEQGLLKTP